MNKHFMFRAAAVLALLFAQPQLASADSNAIALINLTGGITAYDGSGIKIGQLESGVPNSNHVFLAGQIAFTTNMVSGTAGSITAHATQVAGVIVSTGATHIGIAPGSTLYSIAQGTATADVDYVNNFSYLANVQGTRVINQSFAGGFPTVGTGVWERAMDN